MSDAMRLIALIGFVVLMFGVAGIAVFFGQRCRAWSACNGCARASGFPASMPKETGPAKAGRIEILHAERMVQIDPRGRP